MKISLQPEASQTQPPRDLRLSYADLQRLREQLSSETRNERRAAMEELASYDDEDALQLLASKLESADKELRWQALTQLAIRQDRRAGPALEAMFAGGAVSHPDPYLQVIAVLPKPAQRRVWRAALLGPNQALRLEAAPRVAAEGGYHDLEALYQAWQSASSGSFQNLSQLASGILVLWAIFGFVIIPRFTIDGITLTGVLACLWVTAGLLTSSIEPRQRARERRVLAEALALASQTVPLKATQPSAVLETLQKEFEKASRDLLHNGSADRRGMREAAQQIEARLGSSLPVVAAAPEPSRAALPVAAPLALSDGETEPPSDA